MFELSSQVPPSTPNMTTPPCALLSVWLRVRVYVYYNRCILLLLAQICLAYHV